MSLILPRSVARLQSCSRDSLRIFAASLVLLVDEGQDCCGAQLTILRLLHEHGARVCIVGDPRQSIYAFMGADALGMYDLPWPRKRLNENRRSARAVVALANLLVSTAVPQCSGLARDLMEPQTALADSPPGRPCTLRFAASTQY